MFTVEINETDSVIITIDDNDAYDDVELVLKDTGDIFITQHIQDVDEVNVIYMSYQQLQELFAGLGSPEGAYHISMEEVH